MGRFRYNFQILTNRKTFRDLSETSPLRKLLTIIKAELSGESRLVSEETLGEGDGVEKDYTGTLEYPGVRPTSLSIYAIIDSSENRERFIDKGNGTLKSNRGGTGEIDYTTGAYSVSFNTAPKSGEKVYGDYIGKFTTYKFTSDALNPLYDARFIPYASGEELDLWGQTLEVERKQDEPDADYRERLLDELRDFTASLTVDAIKDEVEEVMGEGYRPTVKELWQFAPDWPLEWWDDDGLDTSYNSWVPWEELVDFLVVFSTLVENEHIETGDGEEDQFSGYLVLKPVKAGSLLITDGVETFTDDGEGNLNGDKGGTGTITYTSGEYTLDFNTPPGVNVPILADYTALKIPTEAQLNDIVKDLAAVKFAPARCLLVTDPQTGQYHLEKVVE